MHLQTNKASKKTQAGGEQDEVLGKWPASAPHPPAMVQCGQIAGLGTHPRAGACARA